MATATARTAGPRNAPARPPAPPARGSPPRPRGQRRELTSRRCPRQPDLEPCGRGGSGRDLILARTPARPLARDDLAAQEQLSAPDAPWLPALDGAGQAPVPDRAVGTQRLGELHVVGRLGEEQVGIACTWQLRGRRHHRWPDLLRPDCDRGDRPDHGHPYVIRLGRHGVAKDLVVNDRGGSWPVHRCVSSHPLVVACIAAMTVTWPSDSHDLPHAAPAMLLNWNFLDRNSLDSSV